MAVSDLSAVTPVERRVTAQTARLALIAVALLYVIVDLVVVAPHAALNADESLYASEVNPRVPAQFFSAPRARGITYLLAPIVHLTSSTTALRAYLAVVSGVALVAAFWPWLRALHRPALAPVAAACFAGLWSAQFYGAAAWPNAWVAFAAILTTGWFVRFGQQRSTLAIVWVALGSAALMLLRPSDAVLLLLPLLAALAVVKRWRSFTLALALIGGALIGLIEWIIDADRRFGGLGNRLHSASREQGGIGWHPDGALFSLRALAGPALCRPCTATTGDIFSHRSGIVIALWWLAMPLLVIAGLVVARQAGQLADLLVPTASGTMLALSYLLTVNYAAPRFLVPTYGLFALPVAVALAALFRALHRSSAPVRWSLQGALGLALAVVLVAQVDVLTQQSSKPAAAPYAIRALRAMDVDRPCVVAGLHAPQVAYDLGCRTSRFEKIKLGSRKELTVLLTHRDPSRAEVRGGCWREIELAHPRHYRRWWAYLRNPGPPGWCLSPASPG